MLAVLGWFLLPFAGLAPCGAKHRLVLLVRACALPSPTTRSATEVAANHPSTASTLQSERAWCYYYRDVSGLGWSGAQSAG